MKLTVRLGDRADLEWGQSIVEANHYLRQRVHPRARPMIYIVEYQGQRLGLCIVGLPHATKKKGWWGEPGRPTQWQVVDLSRIYLFPCLQSGGEYCRPDIVPGFADRNGVWRPAVATWLLLQVLSRVQRDRVSLWPPVILSQPYHIKLVISYHDPLHHRGTIYRQSGATPVYTDNQGISVAGPSGKHLWAWKLPDPDWNWTDIIIMQPRTLRLALNQGVIS